MKNLLKTFFILLGFTLTSAFAAAPQSVTLYNYNHGIHSSQNIAFTLPNGVEKVVGAGQEVVLNEDERARLSDAQAQAVKLTITMQDGRKFTQTTSPILFKAHVRIDATMYATGPGPKDFEHGYSWRWIP